MINNIEKKYYSLAGIYIELQGKGELFKLLQDEFDLSEIAGKRENIDLKINILTPDEDIKFMPKFYSLSGSIAFNDTDFMKKEKGYTYLVKNLFDFSSDTELVISYKNKQMQKSLIKNLLKTFISESGYNNYYTEIKNHIMSYSLLWYIFHIVLLKKDSAFIHSSILEYNNKGIIFSGTGGCGKTSTTFRLLDEEVTKYLSEDFGIVNADGYAFFNPKKMSIYQTDVKYGQKDLVDYINKKMPKIDKLLWNISKLLGRNPKRKISPATLIGKNRITKKTKIKEVYYLARSESTEVYLKDISNEDLIERSLNASFRELKMLFELIKNIQAVSYKENKFPGINEIENKTRSVYERAFKNADKKILYVPLKSSPEKTLKEIGMVK